MTSPHPRVPWLRAAGSGAAALALAAAACKAPGPAQPPPPVQTQQADSQQAQMQPGQTEPARRPEAVLPHERPPEEMVAAVRAHYPEVFHAAPTDSTALMFVLAPDGSVQRHQRLSAWQIGKVHEGRYDTWPALVGLSGYEIIASTRQVSSFAPGVLGPGQVELVWVHLRTRRQRDSITMADAERSLRWRREEQMRSELMRDLVVEHMPEVAARGTTADFVWFFLDHDGTVLHHGTSSDPDLSSRSFGYYPSGVRVYDQVIVLNGHRIKVNLNQVLPEGTDPRKDLEEN
ncbi:MAG TPA: hypothetical protein VHG08_02215 [Longimicrobium sp.]|nr:hypothetical protein [Longimicrobium sp.]